MAEREWKVEVDGETHRVRMRHSMWVDDCRVWVDDQPAAIEPRFPFALIDYANDYVFTVGGRDVVLSVRQRGSGYCYRLTVEGFDADTGKPGVADPTGCSPREPASPISARSPRARGSISRTSTAIGSTRLEGDARAAYP